MKVAYNNEAAIDTTVPVHGYRSKHDKVIPRRQLSRSTWKKIIVAELIVAAVLTYAFFAISWSHIVEKRTVAVEATMEGFNSARVTTLAGRSYKTVSESIKEVRNETVWMKREANFRTGPDTSYTKLGRLNKYAVMTRTGVTYNKWSRVEVNGEECYIKSRHLTTEAPLVTATGRKGQYQLYALSQFAQYGWADSEIYSLIKLWDRESGWNPSAHNRSSGAHGIPQALPASKMAAYGSDYYTNGNTQIRWGLNYIARRYGSPSNAWASFQRKGWY